MNNIPIGRLTRSSTTNFVFACRIPEPEVPLFGAFVKAPSQRGQTDVIGLIHDIAFTDDLLVRQVAVVPNLPEEIVRDQRDNRQVPIEVGVLAVGYKLGGRYEHSLPPQPPVTLDQITPCTPDEICLFTERLDFIRLILAAPIASSDELIVAALRAAADCRQPDDRAAFAKQAGRELARLLSRDLARLESLLRRIKP